MSKIMSTKDFLSQKRVLRLSWCPLLGRHLNCDQNDKSSTLFITLVLSTCFRQFFFA